MAVVTAREEVCIPIGEYGLEVLGVEPVEGNFGPQFKWSFQLTAPARAVKEFGDKQFVAWTSTSDSLKGKFMKWATACYNRPIAAGEQVDTDRLQGRRVVAAIVKEEKDDGIYNKIDSLSPYKKAEPMAFETDAVPDDDDFPVGDEDDIFANE